MMFICLLSLVYLLSVNTCGAEGKYQAISIGKNRHTIFILDTETGDAWTIKSLVQGSNKILYHGQIIKTEMTPNISYSFEEVRKR